MSWKTNTTLIAVLMGVAAATPVRAQDAVDQSKYVSREEYDKLKKDFESFKLEMKKTQETASKHEDIQQYMEYLEQQQQKTNELAKAATPGSTKFVITGYGFVDYTDRKHDNNTFEAGVNPILLWEINERLLFQTELEVKLPDDDSTSEGEVALEFANLSYQINDYITVGGGKFLTPFGFFADHVHPAWINKLPDFPLVYDEDFGLVPFQQLGAFVNGGIPIGGDSKIKYDFYVSNGPTLRTGDFAAEASELGTLNASNNNDLNNNKAAGGRVGFLPFSQLEVDYSFLTSQVNPDGTEKVNALLQAVSLNYKQDIDPLAGTVQVLAEYSWWNMDRATYDTAGTFGGPFTFKNNRSGGYAQVAYRPSKVNNPIIKNIEGVFRYSFINEPSDAPDRHDRKNYTIGLDYWLTPSTVLKIAYEIDDQSGGQDQNALLIEAAMGF